MKNVIAFKQPKRFVAVVIKQDLLSGDRVPDSDKSNEVVLVTNALSEKEAWLRGRRSMRAWAKCSENKKYLRAHKGPLLCVKEKK